MSGPPGVRVEGTREPWRLRIYGRTGADVSMTDEQREAKIRALLNERAGYVAQNNGMRVEQVDAELRAYGAQARVPAVRAAKRVEKPAETR